MGKLGIDLIENLLAIERAQFRQVFDDVLAENDAKHGSHYQESRSDPTVAGRIQNSSLYCSRICDRRIPIWRVGNDESCCRRPAALTEPNARS
jgi:hypothetical protein